MNVNLGLWFVVLETHVCKYFIIIILLHYIGTNVW